ncbi:hypothetical protein B0H17DRAFT_937097, partial [Mycena rosella]
MACNCRSLFTLVQGCMATIFMCLYTTMHLNVPPLGTTTTIAIFRRRLLFLGLTLLIPELAIGWAFRQRSIARQLSKDLNITMTHAFFVVMGGFASRGGEPIVTRHQLGRPGILEEIRETPIVTIKDKAKGESFSEAFMILQAGWSIVEIVARAASGLPPTELELSTTGFAVVGIATLVINWNKPLDVQQPLRI